MLYSLVEIHVVIYKFSCNDSVAFRTKSSNKLYQGNTPGYGDPHGVQAKTVSHDDGYYHTPILASMSHEANVVNNYLRYQIRDWVGSMSMSELVSLDNELQSWISNVAFVYGNYVVAYKLHLGDFALTSNLNQSLVQKEKHAQGVTWQDRVKNQEVINRASL
ncbi:hypothetical protein CAPTEDRAFT_191227 [Capitella teleta]|uniref:Uncharacterized protein n=1 Tax=Capitella teleta TaxID=283909 RepID=R7TF27_CAPTE|nr:hypothetical protein CAPTEDRAFT_191227 [Capitella teleta]|eukprot:ELT92348.1 hypothetical protein CAPTEDRAFT_191227 [Capitella teleta]